MAPPPMLCSLVRTSTLFFFSFKTPKKDYPLRSFALFFCSRLNKSPPFVPPPPPLSPLYDLINSVTPPLLIVDCYSQPVLLYPPPFGDDSSGLILSYYDDEDMGGHSHLFLPVFAIGSLGAMGIFLRSQATFFPLCLVPPPFPVIACDFKPLSGMKNHTHLPSCFRMR